MSQTRTALIVDDEEQLLRLVSRLLDRAGYQTRTAQDLATARAALAADAADAASGDKIDLLVLDVNLTAEGGAAELLPEILAERPGLQVILMSGDRLPPELEAQLASIGGDFLRKPFVPATLLRLVGVERTPNRDDRLGAAPSGPGLS